ncbi:uncharacterized protein CIMG_00203 [Coccidioides immitis RS]|uniref:Uncharacterized protein n=4 Tax=Coccidioides immitis TaxID=5501 RepID=J3KGH9_COCIM|nr:uncharacterized protein CIMG_00203 [Coccidioides immitis RS]EAS34849.3 hypothetical protein CIMG_00203 [Coccidioides immitis RS]KMP00037.1 hypothetical protein CIRG_00179 [Coccidioides immitis RMSCC 2394]KMU92273.1 hypothetical protein CIHG_10117 [Coccidioides immitis H538.4]
MSPRRADLRISAPLSNPALRTESSQGPNTYPPLTPIIASDPSQRQTHASYPPMHSSLPFDGTDRTSYHNRFASHDPQSSVSISAGQSPTMHRRRASTLRTIMRKLFGRKRKSDPAAQQQGFHVKDHPTTPSQGSVGLLSSHSPFVTVSRTGHYSIKSPSSPEHLSRVATPTEAIFAALPSPPEETEQAEDASQLVSQRRRPRRRATLPSLVLSTDEARELASKIAHEGSKDGSAPPSPTDGKSTVISSRKTDTQLKRRSRSAYGLRESARAHRMSPIQWRRRSDEMKLWRASFDKRIEPDPIQDRPETRSTAAEEKDPTEIRVESLAPNGELGQFDFGNLMSNIQEDNSASLTQRVATLEVKMMDLEFAIGKMQGSDISPIQPHPSTLSSKECKTEPHNPALQPPLPPLSSFLRVSPGHNPAPPRTSPTNTDRPTSTATLRPHTATAHSSPPITPSPFSPGISVEQYSALTTIVRREQAARKHLEKQVLQLQRELQILRGGLTSGQASFLRPSSPDSPSTTSSHPDMGHDRMDSGMWRQNSESSGAKSGNVSLESYPMKSESSFHRLNPFDKIMGRS